jgi:hypothetical protein
MALFMHTPATLRDLGAALGEFQARIETAARQLEAAKIADPMGIDYQVRVEKALEGLNAFCADAEMRIRRRTYSPRREPPSLPSGREDVGHRAAHQPRRRKPA